jgi:hypothetical protein
VWLTLLVVSFGLSACGTSYYFGGRTLPANKVLNRVLIAIQNPSVLTKGALQEVDGLYDVRHVYNGTSPLPSISGYSGSLPVTIQNLPAQTAGAVFNQGDGSFDVLNYSGSSVTTPYTASQLGGIASSIFITPDLQYVFAAQQQNHVLTVHDGAVNGTFFLNIPGVYRVSVNPGGTIVLAFVQNSNAVYSAVHLTADQQTAAIGNPHYLGAQDCEPQNLPVYCAFAVSAGTASFDHPIKAVFSPDGSAAYVLDCGPECGGTTAGVTVIPLTASALNTNTTGPRGIALVASTETAVPGGATNAIFNGNTMYIAGQQLLSDGLFSGQLSIYNLLNNQVTGQYGISDGTHNKMLFGDDNTLWIGSAVCENGERYAQVEAGNTSVPFGCLTMFNTSTNTVTMIDSYKGDATGIAAITGLHKMYTAEGGQVYIYSTADGSALDNTNVTVVGTAIDVAYMDAPTDDNNTTY